MSQLDATTCPICGLPLREPPSRRERPGGDLAYYDCPHCGRYGLTRTASVNLRGWLKASVRNPAIFAHTLRRMQGTQEWPLVDSKIAEQIIATAKLPTPKEQADNLVRWLGSTLAGPGERETIVFPDHAAVIGTFSSDGLNFVVKGLIEEKLLEGLQRSGGWSGVTLTFQGWNRYEELLQGAPSGRNAFMAMQYGDKVLDRIVREHFRPAVAQTGFDLKRLDDDQPAGLIDDRLRVEIQGARFLIADLTHRNPGAYWEAGYAEGLGKPVVYTCDESVFNEKPTHFDTNHHLHVLWKADDMTLAMEKLKATIRATIPESRREDG